MSKELINLYASIKQAISSSSSVSIKKPKLFKNIIY